MYVHPVQNCLFVGFKFRKLRIKVLHLHIPEAVIDIEKDVIRTVRWGSHSIYVQILAVSEYHFEAFNAWYTCASTPAHIPNTFASANGRICVHTMPATPFSLSHHHQILASPAQKPAPVDLPVAPPLLNIKVRPQP
jgi:hypothetical protein